MKKIIAVLLVLTFALTLAGTLAFAQETEGDDTLRAVSFSDEGIRLENATPEEIEDIGVGAMLQAGLISESDANISDVTPAVEQQVEEHPAEETKQGASTLEIVLLVLVIILLIAVAVLYYFCAKMGVLVLNR